MEEMKKCVDCGSSMAGEYISPDEDLCCFCYEGYEMEDARQKEWENRMTGGLEEDSLYDNDEVDVRNYRGELPF